MAPKPRRLMRSRDLVLAEWYPNLTTLCEPPFSCSHPAMHKCRKRKNHAVVKHVCLICGADGMEVDSYVRFGYILKGLGLSKSEIGRLSLVNTDNALRNRKLFLVLDLDQTLLHANVLKDLKPEVKYLLKQTDSLEKNARDGTLFHFPCASVLVKLRPFVREFLQQLSPMFEMYLYTAAETSYTEKLMELLDPGKKYFNWRVITRSDFIHQGYRKDLELVLGQDKATVIIDDTESAWPWHRDNLLPIQRYDYFCPSEIDFPSFFFPSVFHQYREDHYTERRMDEKGRNNKVMLQSILEVLQEIHSQFFDPNIAAQDVPQVIKRVRGQVLKGCKIFLGLGSNFKVINGTLKSMAEELGAVFCAELDSSVTHVVTLPENSHQLVEKNRSGWFVVLPGWIVSSYKSWQRLPEAEYAFKEYIDDTEDFINIKLLDVQGNVQNQLIQFELLLTAATFVATIFAVVTVMFGMNFPAIVFDAFKWVLLIIGLACVLMNFTLLFYFRQRSKFYSLELVYQKKTR